MLAPHLGSPQPDHRIYIANSANWDLDRTVRDDAQTWVKQFHRHITHQGKDVTRGGEWQAVGGKKVQHTRWVPGWPVPVQGSSSWTELVMWVWGSHEPRLTVWLAIARSGCTFPVCCMRQIGLQELLRFMTFLLDGWFTNAKHTNAHALQYCIITAHLAILLYRSSKPKSESLGIPVSRQREKG